MERGKSDTEAATEYVVSTILLQQEKDFFRPDRFGNPPFLFSAAAHVGTPTRLPISHKREIHFCRIIPRCIFFLSFLGTDWRRAPDGGPHPKKAFSPPFSPFWAKGFSITTLEGRKGTAVTTARVTTICISKHKTYLRPRVCLLLLLLFLLLLPAGDEEDQKPTLKEKRRSHSHTQKKHHLIRG